jgi:hypothetical protein
VGKELQNAGNLRARENGESVARPQVAKACSLGAGKIGVLCQIQNQEWLSAGKHPPRETNIRIKRCGFRRALKRSHTLSFDSMPNAGGVQAFAFGNRFDKIRVA